MRSYIDPALLYSQDKKKLNLADPHAVDIAHVEEIDVVLLNSNIGLVRSYAFGLM
jgi:hypothetical protein